MSVKSACAGPEGSSVGKDVQQIPFTRVLSCSALDPPFPHMTLPEYTFPRMLSPTQRCPNTAVPGCLRNQSPDQSLLADDTWAEGAHLGLISNHSQSSMTTPCLEQIFRQQKASKTGASKALTRTGIHQDGFLSLHASVELVSDDDIGSLPLSQV